MDRCNKPMMVMITMMAMVTTMDAWACTCRGTHQLLTHPPPTYHLPSYLPTYLPDYLSTYLPEGIQAIPTVPLANSHCTPTRTTQSMPLKSLGTQLTAFSEARFREGPGLQDGNILVVCLISKTGGGEWEFGSLSRWVGGFACRWLRRRCELKDFHILGSGVYLHYGFGMYGMRMSGAESVCEFLVAVVVLGTWTFYKFIFIGSLV